MARAIGSSIAQPVAGRPGCVRCERWLIPMGERNFYCPCCGEIYALLEDMFGIPSAWCPEMAPAGIERDGADHRFRMPTNHKCPKPRTGQPPAEQTSMLGAFRGDA